MQDIGFSWNRNLASTSPETRLPTGIFFDETLRDGIQAPYVAVPSLAQKLSIVDHMVAAGIRSADLGFPGSGPEAAAECLEIAKYIVGCGHLISQGYAGRAHPSDVRAICEIAQKASVAVDAYIFIGVSPIRQYVEDWNLGFIARSIRAAAAECQRDGVEFVLVLEDTVRCTPEVLTQVYDVAIDIGVRRLVLCDTVGAALPSGTDALIRWSAKHFADHDHAVGFEWHGHNDRGLGVINGLTALAAGCQRVHGAVLGVGERAGNASIDQLIVNSHLDEHDHYNLPALRKYCEYASTVLGYEIPSNYPAMGEAVFSTSAGVHAAAILKAHEKSGLLIKDRVYSSVPASYLGRKEEVLVDSSSGESNVRYWLALRGLQASTASIHEVLRTAKGASRPLSDEEIGRILAIGEVATSEVTT